MKTTDAVVRVAMALMADPFGEHYGYPTIRAARLRSGTVYPVLDRMLQEGWLTDGWEQEPTPGRPPRRYYRVTDEGLRELGALAAQAPSRGLVLGGA